MEGRKPQQNMRCSWPRRVNYVTLYGNRIQTTSTGRAVLHRSCAHGEKVLCLRTGTVMQRIRLPGAAWLLGSPNMSHHVYNCFASRRSARAVNNCQSAWIACFVELRATALIQGFCTLASG